MIRPVFAAVLVAIVAWWLFFTHYPLGIPNQWVLTPNEHPWPLAAWGLPVVVVLIFGSGAALSAFDRFKRAKNRREQTHSTVATLTCLGLILWLWPWAILGPGSIGGTDRAGHIKLSLEGRFNVIAALWSDVATEYFGTAYQIEDARQFGREYAQKWQNPTARVQAHVATHPPGAVLFFYGARRIYENVPFLQNGFSQLASALTSQSPTQMADNLNLLREVSARGTGAPVPTPLPAAAIGSALFCAVLLGLTLVLALPAVYGLAIYGVEEEEREKRGLIAASLWALAPATCLFAFTLDALVASGVVWSLFFASRAFEPKTGRRWAFAAGITLALTSFVSLGALAAGAIVALGCAIYGATREKGRANFLAVFLPPALAFVVGFVIFWIGVALFLGFNPLEVVDKALQAHHFATLEVRSRWAWMGWNLPAFALFLGAAGTVALWNKLPAKRPAIGVCFGWTALLTILLLSLSGNVRGEVERLWLFLLAPLLVWAASSLQSREAAPLIALQIVQTLLLASALAPLVRPF